MTQKNVKVENSIDDMQKNAKIGFVDCWRLYFVAVSLFHMSEIIYRLTVKAMNRDVTWYQHYKLRLLLQVVFKLRFHRFIM